jgi:hypothetical protein
MTNVFFFTGKHFMLQLFLDKRFLPVRLDDFHKFLGMIKANPHPVPAWSAYDLLHQETVRVKPSVSFSPSPKARAPFSTKEVARGRNAFSVGSRIERGIGFQAELMMSQFS